MTLASAAEGPRVFSGVAMLCAAMAFVSFTSPLGRALLWLGFCIAVAGSVVAVREYWRLRRRAR